MAKIRYEDLVEKVAQEILEGSFEEEVLAEEDFDPVLEKVAARIKGINVQDLQFLSKIDGAEGKAARKLLNNAKAKRVAAIAAPLAAAGAGVGALALAKKRKQDQDIAEKAAAYYEEAQMLKQAAQEAFNEAQLYEDAAIEVLAEMGYFEEEE